MEIATAIKFGLLAALAALVVPASATIADANCQSCQADLQRSLSGCGGGGDMFACVEEAIEAAAATRGDCAVCLCPIIASMKGAPVSECFK